MVVGTPVLFLAYVRGFLVLEVPGLSSCASTMQCLRSSWMEACLGSLHSWKSTSTSTKSTSMCKCCPQCPWTSLLTLLRSDQICVLVGGTPWQVQGGGVFFEAERVTMVDSGRPQCVLSLDARRWSLLTGSRLYSWQSGSAPRRGRR